MRYGKYTREQIVAMYGEELITQLEAENCDFTNRLQTDGDTDVEFSASIEAPDDSVITVYYYQSAASLDAVDDLSDLKWEIHGYEVA